MGSKTWSRKCFRPHLGSLAGPNSCSLFHLLRKTSKRLFRFCFLKDVSKFNIYQWKKIKIQKPIISPPNTKIQKFNKNISSSLRTFQSLSTFWSAKEKQSRLFAIFFLQCILHLNTYPKEMHAKIQPLLPYIWGF
jgi:hypothetical protein